MSLNLISPNTVGPLSNAKRYPVALDQATLGLNPTRTTNLTSVDKVLTLVKLEVHNNFIGLKANPDSFQMRKFCNIYVKFAKLLVCVVLRI